MVAQDMLARAPSFRPFAALGHVVRVITSKFVTPCHMSGKNARALHAPAFH